MLPVQFGMITVRAVNDERSIRFHKEPPEQGDDYAITFEVPVEKADELTERLERIKHFRAEQVDVTQQNHQDGSVAIRVNPFSLDQAINAAHPDLDYRVGVNAKRIKNRERTIGFDNSFAKSNVRDTEARTLAYVFYALGLLEEWGDTQGKKNFIQKALESNKIGQADFREWIRGYRTTVHQAVEAMDSAEDKFDSRTEYDGGVVNLSLTNYFA